MEPIQEAAPIAPAGAPLNKVLGGSFAWMALGLFVSALTAIGVLFVPSVIEFILDTRFGFLAMFLIELGIVIYLTKRIATMTAAWARFFFILYSIASGVTLMVIFLAFELSSIFTIFLSTTVMFGVLALYGSRTKRDLTKIGRLAGFALIGLVLASIINLFIHGTIFDLVLSWIGVIVFVVLIAYDVQKIKKFAAEALTPEDVKKASVLGALTLYLDFINLFLNLLRIFGRRK